MAIIVQYVFSTLLSTNLLKISMMFCIKIIIFWHKKLSAN